MQLEIRHLKLVATIAETGSVTLAGNRLHLTQSALSHQLRDAEEQLGVPLFERVNGRMALTSAGERLLESARAILDELERAEKDIRESNGNGTAKGVLRLATECYTCYHWLPARLKLFQQKFPAVDFQLAIEATHSPFEPLLEGKLDLAIVSEPIRNRKIRYTPLFNDEVVIVVPPAHRFAGQAFVAPQDFAEENFIIFPPKEDSTVLMKYIVAAGVSPRKVTEVMLTDTIIEMVKGGLGVTALAKWAVAPELGARALVGLSLTQQGFHRTWWAAQLRDKRTPPYVEEFIRLLIEHPIPQSVAPRKLAPKARLRARTNFQPTAAAIKTA